MARALNQTTIIEYLPIIREIQAFLDFRLQDPDMEKRCCFRFTYNSLGRNYGFLQLANAQSIICGWIDETGIKIGTGEEAYCFIKTNDTGLWSRMHELIEENIDKYEQIGASPTPGDGRRKQTKDKKKIAPQVLVLNEDAQLFNQAHPKKFLDLSKAPLQKKILLLLKNKFTPTKALMTDSGSKSEQSFYKAVGELNADMKRELNLKKNVIENDRQEGYRLAPLYKLINQFKVE